MEPSRHDGADTGRNRRSHQQQQHVHGHGCHWSCAVARYLHLRNTGKRYFECTFNQFLPADPPTVDLADLLYIGLADTAHPLVAGASFMPSITGHGFEFGSNGALSASRDALHVTMPIAGAVIGIAVNFDSRECYASINGTWILAGFQSDPAIAALGLHWGEAPNAALLPYAEIYIYNAQPFVRLTLNEGPTFVHSIPTGYVAWSTPETAGVATTQATACLIMA